MHWCYSSPICTHPIRNLKKWIIFQSNRKRRWFIVVSQWCTVLNQRRRPWQQPVKLRSAISRSMVVQKLSSFKFEWFLLPWKALLLRWWCKLVSLEGSLLLHENCHDENERNLKFPISTHTVINSWLINIDYIIKMI